MGDQKRKKVLNLVAITDYKVLEERYEKMAAEGWLLKKMSGARDVFVQSEPQNLDYSVTVFQPFTGLDYPDQEKGATYREFCEDSGWTFVDSNQRYHVYCKKSGSEAIPIHTNTMDEYETVRKAFMKSEIIFPLLILLQLPTLYLNFMNLNYSDLLWPGMFILKFMPLFFIVMMTLYFIPLVTWFVRNRNRARDGQTLLYKNSKTVKMKNRLYAIIICIYLVITLSGIAAMFFSGAPIQILILVLGLVIIPAALGLLMRNRIKKIRRSRLENGALLLVALVVAWILMLGLTILTIGGIADVERIEEGTLPNVSILTHEDFNTNLDFQPERIDIHHSLWAPLSFNYVSYHRSEEEVVGIEDIRLEYIEARTLGIKDLIVQLIIREEEQRIERDIEYLEVSDRPIDYVRAIKGYEDRVDLIYNISSYNNEVIMAKGKIIYIVNIGEVFDDERLGQMIEKLF